MKMDEYWENDHDVEIYAACDKGYCYDCGELNCGGINSLTGEKDH